MPTEPRPDAGYAHPDAFRLAKRAFRGEDAGRLLERLEANGLSCPRLMLSACIHHFLSLSRPEQAAILLDYLHACDGPASDRRPRDGASAPRRPAAAAAASSERV